MSAPERYIGLMSGTSMDSVDAVLALFDTGATGDIPTSDGMVSIDIPPALRAELMALQQPGSDELARAALAGNALADLYARAVNQLLAEHRLAAADITALGAHGQTVRHRPELGYTLQLLNGARLAEATGIDTVCDLRSADVAAGGQGAPLVPAFHARVFAAPGERRAIVNIGGIANVSLLAPDVAGVIGFDTGPGNLLMDGWIHRHLGQAYDAAGRWAASGQVSTALQQQLRSDRYFGLPAPKSTGRDLFHLDWMDRQLAGELPPVDVQATLAELTASTIADACREFGARQLFVCGGGARNDHLMGRLAALLPGCPVAATGALGIDPQAVEALAFAWLAKRRIDRLPANYPAVTGARGPRVLGALHLATR